MGIDKNMKSNGDTGSKSLEKFRFATRSKPVLKEIGTEPVGQILQMSFSVEIYAGEDQLIRQLLFRVFRERHLPVAFLRVGQNVLSTLQPTVRRPSSIWTMRTPLRFEALIFLPGIALARTSLASKLLSCFHTYEKETLIAYTVQNVANAWISLSHSAGIRPFLKVFFSYLMFNRKKIFEAYTEKLDGYAPESRPIELAKRTDPVN